ncbi:dihydrofolate reductase family protein [Candidatus Electrothrix sp.]|uniref:dihydrofolate reductase family protein n=1 Tax=Candidatus Electrothrix sp. TaxID=2170559 RepID=UPI004057753B
MANKVFVGTSLDGYIADRDNGLDFLESVPNPDGHDLGFVSFMKSVDAVLMGRKTFEAVLSFDMPWYAKPVFVFSSTLKEVPAQLQGKVEIVSAPLKEVIKVLTVQGMKDFYIDGGQLIQSFLAEDMIDELIVTQVPVLIGDGTPLYGLLPRHLEFELVKSEVLLQALVQSHYRRLRKESKEPVYE